MLTANRILTKSVIPSHTLEVATAAEQDVKELRPEPRSGIGGVGGGHFSPSKRRAGGSGGGVAAAGTTRTALGVEQLASHQVPPQIPPRDGHVREVRAAGGAGAREEEDSARAPRGRQRGRHVMGPPRQHRRRSPARPRRVRGALRRGEGGWGGERLLDLCRIVCTSWLRLDLKLY